MAVLALAAGGAAIGSQIAATTMLPLWLASAAPSVGWAVGTMVGNAAFGPKAPDQNQSVQGPRFADLRIQSSAYGQMVPIIYGSMRVSGNVIWASSVREVETVTTTTTGGGGGGGGKGGGGGGGGGTVTQTTTTYQYFVDAAFLICEGEMAALRRSWVNTELKYDVSAAASSSSVAASALGARALRFYPGSESQSVDPTIEAAEGADAPAYRGYCYVVLENLDVTPYGGKLPQIEFEVVGAGSVASALAISAGTAFATSATVTVTTTPVLGRQGNVWFVGAVSNTAVMANFYTSAIQATYTRALWGYAPFDINPYGEAVYNNGGGNFGILHDDGSVTEYTGSATLGLNGSVAWLDDLNGFAQGDGSSSLNLRRFVLNSSAMTFTSTLLSAARSRYLFRNATGISGRCYCYGSSSFSHDVGYIETASNSKVLLFTGTSYEVLGCLVSRDGYLWMSRSTANRVEKRDRDGNLIGTASLSSGPATRLFEGPDGTIFACTSSGPIYGIHPTTLTVDFGSENVGTKVPIGVLPDGRVVLYSSSAGTYYFHQMERLARVTVGDALLSAVVTDLCDRVGLDSGDIDVSELDEDVVRGYAIARPDTARSAIEPLRLAYRFDALESDGQVVFRKRGQSVAAVIDEDDLAARRYGEEPPAKVAAEREIETALPQEVAVSYFDQDAVYELGSQYARRLTGESDLVETIQLPVVLSAAEAAGVAEFLLFDRWVSRNTQRISLSRKWSHLEPTDVVQIEADGIAYTSRITDSNFDRGVVTLTLVDDDAEVVSTSATGVSAPERDDVVAGIGPTVLRVLDIPLLRDSDDGAGCYIAACGLYDGWRGAELFVSRDDGVTWNSASLAITSAAVIGSAVTVLANFGGGNVFDEISTVDVQVLGGELSSATEDLVRSGTNTCYLGGELLAFKSATLVSSGRYRLSGLRRGRKGTEQYMSTHAIGDPFVLLANAKRLALTTADIGVPLLLKAVTFGGLLAETDATSFTPAAVGLEPLSPVNIRAGRSAASAPYDITIAWTRRNRLDAEWRSYSDVPQSESSESYEVEIYTSSAFTTVKRTITGLSSATTTYTAAQQTTDFGGSQTTIYVKVYQLSSVTGRGFAGTATLTV